MGASGGPIVRLAPVADVAAGFGVEGGLGLLADSATGSVRGSLEQALTMAAAPTLPASPSSRRRLTKSGRSSGRSGAGASMVLTIRIYFSLAGCLCSTSVCAPRTIDL
jgi:hypothetical protein